MNTTVLTRAFYKSKLPTHRDCKIILTNWISQRPIWPHNVNVDISIQLVKSWNTFVFEFQRDAENRCYLESRVSMFMLRSIYSQLKCIKRSCPDLFICYKLALNNRNRIIEIPWNIKQFFFTQIANIFWQNYLLNAWNRFPFVQKMGFLSTRLTACCVVGMPMTVEESVTSSCKAIAYTKCLNTIVLTNINTLFCDKQFSHNLDCKIICVIISFSFDDDNLRLALYHMFHAEQ